MFHRLWIAVVSLFLFVSVQAFESISDFENHPSELRALVFLSRSCPCSRSHVEHLNELNRQKAFFQVFGVITDPIEPGSKGDLEAYFDSSRFQFPIIADPEQKLLKKFGALKTPHVVLVKKKKGEADELLYEGGVSDHRIFSRSTKRFLQENLLAYEQGQVLPYSQGKSLGCYIRRL